MTRPTPHTPRNQTSDGRPRPDAALALALLATVAVVLASARADGSTADRPETLTHRTVAEGSPFQVRWELDLSITVTGLVVGLLPGLTGIQPGPMAGLAAPDPAQLNSLDRRVIGKHSQAAARASDALLWTSVSLPLVASLVDLLANDPRDGLGGTARDMLVLAETAAVTVALCNLVKYSVHRARPYAYDPDATEARRGAADARLSFFSGHTALAFAMATSYSYLHSKRHPDSRFRGLVWASSHALAAGVAVLRVEAGRHFWTDVLAGAAVGSTVGYLVPLLHTRGVLGSGDDRTPPTLTSMKVTPTFQRDGFGLAFSADF